MENKELIYRLNSVIEALEKVTPSCGSTNIGMFLGSIQTLKETMRKVTEAESNNDNI